MSARLHPKTQRLLMRLLDAGVKPETITKGLDYHARRLNEIADARKAREVNEAKEAQS